MPTLEDDSLVFRFPHLEKEASFSIQFMRTLRIPDTDETYDLPPGLGVFPVRHTEDFASTLPESTKTRGGVILPMWQAEAMWLSFTGHEPEEDLEFPVAVKVAAGKINAVSGAPWQAGLCAEPQDYLVAPNEPWLDGFAVEKGVIRQFVAMPLGEGYSAEEQLTGKAEWGGLQIQVIPLKPHVWWTLKAEWARNRDQRRQHYVLEERCDRIQAPTVRASTMALAPGGRMHQTIDVDSFGVDAWDQSSADRVFVSLLHAKDWKGITGENAPNHPPTAQEYSDAGLPWFKHYGNDQQPLSGSSVLSKLKSLGSLFKEKTGATLPNSDDVSVQKTLILGSGPQRGRPVKNQGGWDV